ncbi:HIT family protein [Candidatus Kaiserbacteria bacterium]|nr:HIT family protein [Candidatus Kaiserbacteria bacterium]USN92474.1 MAG: HIT family protein [Candidatus Nomurabacteria bacterium]
MATIFSKIIAREIPAQFVFEDEVCVVIMDKFPAIRGQLLVIPKIEVDYIFDLPEDVYLHLFKIAKKVAVAADKAFETFRTCIIVEGFEVPHVHVKVYPMMAKEHLGVAISQKPNEASDVELLQQAGQIRAKLQ